MAARFWVGGTGTWDNADTTHWAATSNGAGGQSVPGSGDTVTFDGSSGGGTVTPNYNMTVTSITMGAFTGTLDFSANNNSPTMSTFSGTGTGTRTLNMGTGTWTLTGTGTVWTTATTTNLTLDEGNSTINLTDSSGSARTITCGSQTVGRLYNVKVSAGTGGITQTQLACNNLDYTGFSGSITSGTIDIAGSFTLSPTMISATGFGLLTFDGTSGSHTVTTFGLVIGSVGSNDMLFSGVGGTWTLQDDLTHARNVRLAAGALNLNNMDVQCVSFNISGSGVKVLNMGSSTITATTQSAGSTNFISSGTTNLTLNAGTSMVSMLGTGNPPVFLVQEPGYTFYDISITATGTKTITVEGPFTCNSLTLSGTSTGNYNISGSNNVGTLTINNPHTIRFEAGTTQTLSNPPVVGGIAGSLNVLKSQTDGSAWYLSKASGTVSVDYVSLQDSYAIGGAYFDAGGHSIDVSNNEGWNIGWAFVSKPTGSSYTNVAKPTGANYTNVNTQGKEQYDQPSLMYDDSTIYYDGVDYGAYTNVSKP